jgi:hypothetical protein
LKLVEEGIDAVGCWYTRGEGLGNVEEGDFTSTGALKVLFSFSEEIKTSFINEILNIFCLLTILIFNLVLKCCIVASCPCFKSSFSLWSPCELFVSDSVFFEIGIFLSSSPFVESSFINLLPELYSSIVFTGSAFACIRAHYINNGCLVLLSNIFV